MSCSARYGFKRIKYKRLIQMCLDDAGKTQKEFAMDIGVTSQTVSATINGKINSPKVIDALRKIGVSEKYLCDPSRMQKISIYDEKIVAR